MSDDLLQQELSEEQLDAMLDDADAGLGTPSEEDAHEEPEEVEETAGEPEADEAGTDDPQEGTQEEQQEEDPDAEWLRAKRAALTEEFPKADESLIDALVNREKRVYDTQKNFHALTTAKSAAERKLLEIEAAKQATTAAVPEDIEKLTDMMSGIEGVQAGISYLSEVAKTRDLSDAEWEALYTEGATMAQIFDLRQIQEAAKAGRVEQERTGQTAQQQLEALRANAQFDAQFEALTGLSPETMQEIGLDTVDLTKGREAVNKEIYDLPGYQAIAKEVQIHKPAGKNGEYTTAQLESAARAVFSQAQGQAKGYSSAVSAIQKAARGGSQLNRVAGRTVPVNRTFTPEQIDGMSEAELDEALNRIKE